MLTNRAIMKRFERTMRSNREIFEQHAPRSNREILEQHAPRSNREILEQVVFDDDDGGNQGTSGNGSVET
jgi:hypothetical protein